MLPPLLYLHIQSINRYPDCPPDNNKINEAKIDTNKVFRLIIEPLITAAVMVALILTLYVSGITQLELRKFWFDTA